MKKNFVVLLLLSITILVCSCSPTVAYIDRSAFSMDTHVTVRFYGEERFDVVQDLLSRFEKLWDVTDVDSELYRWNQDHGAPLSDQTLELVNKALYYCEQSDGNLDITLLPMTRLWGFQDGEFCVPGEDEIHNTLNACGYDKIDVMSGGINADDNVLLDLGAVAKGYAGDLIADALKTNGIKSCLISLGGNVRTLGNKPDGSAWSVGIQDPNDQSAIVGRLLFHGDRSVVTSGSYQRFFEKDGEKYCHIIDPKTGCPVNNGLASVTVVCSEGVMADSFSTALFVMGREKAIEFYRSREDFEMILISSDGKIEVTSGLQNEFSLNSTESEDGFTIIERGTS